MRKLLTYGAACGAIGAATVVCVEHPPSGGDIVLCAFIGLSAVAWVVGLLADLLREEESRELLKATATHHLANVQQAFAYEWCIKWLEQQERYEEAAKLRDAKALLDEVNRVSDGSTRPQAGPKDGAQRPCDRSAAEGGTPNTN